MLNSNEIYSFITENSKKIYILITGLLDWLYGDLNLDDLSSVGKVIRYFIFIYIVLCCFNLALTITIYKNPSAVVLIF